jgi:hypothetical protein
MNLPLSAIDGPTLALIVTAVFGFLGLLVNQRYEFKKAEAQREQAKELLRLEREAEREMRLAEKQAQYKREDEVAGKVASAAAKVETVAEQAAQAAKLLVRANARVDENAKATTQQLEHLEAGQKQIHTLVNSNLTAAVDAQLTALDGQLVLMERVIELDREAGREPTAQALSALEPIRAKVTELRTTLAERKKQTQVAEDQVKK